MAGILNAELAFPQFPALDQYGPNTTLLLHGDGTNGAQNNTFLDSSTNNFTITRNGNTTQGTFSPFSQPNGWWSNYFPADNATYLFVASNAAFNLNTYVCLECWVNFATVGSGGSSALIIGRESNFWLAYDYNGIGGASGKFVFTILNSGSSWQAVSSTTTPIAGQWYHVVGIKDNTTLRIYINGNQENTASFSGSPANTANGISIGSLVGSQGPYKGYVSNARLVISASNVLPYTGNFTPPTTPLTAVTGTALLTCQSNRFVDNSTNAFTVTPNGSPSVQAFHPISAPTAYYPAVNGGAGYFDGSGDYLSAGSNAAFAFGTGAYTVEMWVNPSSISQQVYLFNDTTGGSGFYFETSGSAGFTIAPRATGSPLVTGGYSNLQANAWNHVVFCRASTSSNQTSIFVNGTRVANGTDNTNWTVNGPCLVGGLAANIYMFAGYMSQVRVVKGTDVYGYSNTSITVPTTPLTAITNTSLLLSCTNAGIIDSVSQNQLETVGNAQVSTTQSKFGGASMYFDGSTSYASFLNNPINVLGDFTVEGWFYSASATSSFMGLFGFGAISSSISPVTLILGNATSGPNAASSVNLLVSVDGSNWAINSASASGTTSNNAWIHFAVVRSGGTFTVYLNGNAVITSTAIASTTSLYSGGTINRVGAYGYSGYYYSGYIDDFRVTKGIARYTQNFTPPQNAFPDYGPLTNIPTVDPNFKNTTLLLHGNGTNGAQNNTFLDSSTNNFTITRNGNTTQGTFTPFSQPNGWWSNYLDGSSYLTSAVSSNLALGSSDFTVEYWVYFPSLAGAFSNLTFGNGGTGGIEALFGWYQVSSTGGQLALFLSSNGSSYDVASNVTLIPAYPALGVWHHVAVTRSGSTFRTFWNGVQQATFTSSASLYQNTNQITVGRGQGSYYPNAYISNVRFVKGTSLYNSNFTPSTTPLAAVTNTQYLTCQSNCFIDNSTNAFTITPSGTPSVQNFYPFFPPLDYSTAAIGGSGYFDGSGDYLSSSVGAIGTGDFTVEYWSYLNVLNAAGQPGYFQISGTSGGLSTTYTAGLLALDNGSLYVNVGGTTIATSHTLVRYQWFHTAIVRSSGTVSVYVNGSLVSTPTSITTNLTGTYIALGGYYSTGYLMTGYLSGFRVLVGTALYTSTFVPPTLPPTAIANTSFLANFTNGGIFDNASKNDLETVGNAQISTTQSKFGGSSIYVDGASYTITSSNQPFALGTSNFTVEYWIYFNSTAANGGALIIGSGSSGYDALFGWMSGSGGPFTLYLSSSNSSWDIANNVTIIPATISTGQWYHVAVTRSGSTFRTFCNGNQTSTITSSASIYQSDNRTVVGKYQGGAAYYINAYIDDIRITNGVSRYNSNFTPPAAPFPNK